MGLTIMTNPLALNAQRNLETSGRRLENTLNRLSSGSRITKAADDAAGLAISDQLNAEIRSLAQGVRNAQDGISLVQVYEGGTNEINNMLMRVRELAMQASSDTVGKRERIMLNAEVQQTIAEIHRVAASTKYAGQTLLDGNYVKMEFQVGSGNVAENDRVIFAPGSTDMRPEGLGIDDLNVLDKETAQDSLTIIDDAMYQVNDIRAKVGSTQSRLLTTVLAQSVFQENLLSAKARIRDTDVAQESSNLARETILRRAGIAVLTQANETPSLALRLLQNT